MADDKRSQQVTLGCGTLLLIAIIVAIFGGWGTKDLEGEVRGLRTEVNELKKSVEAQTHEIKQLHEKLEKQAGAAKEKDK